MTSIILDIFQVFEISFGSINFYYSTSSDTLSKLAHICADIHCKKGKGLNYLYYI